MAIFFKVVTTSKLDSHPCVVTVEEMAAARHFIKTQVKALGPTNGEQLIFQKLTICLYQNKLMKMIYRHEKYGNSHELS